MFGMLEAMLSFLRRQVGLRTDAADANGSLHAKVAAVKESISGEIGTSADGRADNTVMGWLNTPIKSWQRVVGTTENNGPFPLAISTVNPAKCLVFINGAESCYDTQGRQHAIRRYISNFTSNGIWLSVSNLSFVQQTWYVGTYSVIIVEFY